jgi:hypothetical protein
MSGIFGIYLILHTDLDYLQVIPILVVVQTEGEKIN